VGWGIAHSPLLKYATGKYRYKTETKTEPEIEEREVYSPRYNNTAVKLTASKHKVEGCQKGIKPILAGHPL